MSTLTYNYADQAAVLGPLATYAEPHAYDLCDVHSERLSAPRGWEVMRLANEPSSPTPSNDDLVALANLVREAGRPPVPAPRPENVEGSREVARRGHLRILRAVEESSTAGPVTTPGYDGPYDGPYDGQHDA